MNPFLTPVVPEPTVRGRVYRAPEMRENHPEWAMGAEDEFVMGLALSDAEADLMQRHGHEPFSWEQPC